MGLATAGPAGPPAMPMELRYHYSLKQGVQQRSTLFERNRLNVTLGRFKPSMVTSVLYKIRDSRALFSLKETTGEEITLRQEWKKRCIVKLDMWLI